MASDNVKGVSVTEDFFHVLGVGPFLGRGFLRAEARPGGPRVAVLSHGLWQARFGADPGVLGRHLTINGEDYTVVGVMRRGFSFTPEADIWLPVQLAIGPQDQEHNYGMIARLRPSVTLEKAQADVEKIFGEFQHDFPKIPVPGERGMILRSYQRWLAGDLRTSLLVLLGAVGFVLLIASANVANLLLSRAAAQYISFATTAGSA